MKAMSRLWKEKAMSGKFEIHRTTCPTLTWIPFDRRRDGCCDNSQMVAVDRKQFEELVLAAEIAHAQLLRYSGSTTLSIGARLSHRLQPFRRSEK